jgi:type II secretory ATPase GspE/PulE/Tfp pilus assembly ATPase PilB-like protein
MMQSHARKAPGADDSGPADSSPKQLALPAQNPRELQETISRLGGRRPLRLDQAFVLLGLITPGQLKEARKAKAKNPSQPMGEIFQRLGIASQEAVNAGLAFQLGIPAVDIRHWPFDPAVRSSLSAAVALRCAVVPVHLDGNTLYIAMSDVLDRDVLDALRVSTPHNVRPVYAPKPDIQWMLNRHYLADSTSCVSDADLERETSQYVAEFSAPRQESVSATDNVIVRLADQIIAEAYRERASDIHIEPMPDQGKTVVRVRIDGQMFARRSIPGAYRDALVSRYKVMANLNLAEHRVPQDGKIVFRKPGATPIELRIAVLPTAGGVEDVVLRILDTNPALPMTSLGLCDTDHRRLEELVAKPYGILLVCGPTGSGKTTTLHALLRQLNDGSRKIWTVENPVEITQPGLRQVEVLPRAGLTFATALRAFLRADPDVIMVGEIRDEETAKTALEASLTGHLVLSTLHTNNAPESVVRLLEMGMNPFNFSDALLGIVAQRLVRCLCEHCRQPVIASDEMLLRLAHEHNTAIDADDGARQALVEAWRRKYGDDGEVTLYTAKGCTECANTGYSGRIGIFELMPASAEIKRLIINGAPAAELFQLALREGMQTLKQDGIRKVLEGATELSQVLSVSQR